MVFNELARPISKYIVMEIEEDYLNFNKSIKSFKNVARMMPSTSQDNDSAWASNFTSNLNLNSVLQCEGNASQNPG